MLHSRFRGNRPVGSGEDFLKGFYYIWAWRPSWSCDSDAVSNFCPPSSMRLHIKFGFDLPSGFRGEDV